MNGKTIDEAVKGLAPDKTITIYDNFDLHNAVYVSAKDNVERIVLTDADTSASDKKFEAAAAKVKKILGDRPAIVAKADATHYGLVNYNFSWYNPKYIRQNSSTWLQKTANGTYGRPVQTDHNMDSDKTLGRVLGAIPIIYPQDSEDLYSADAHIQLIYYISDSMGIERVIDGRYKTLSVSAGSSADQVTCSICGRSVASWDCNHTRGKSYDLEEGDEVSSYHKRTKKSNMTKDGKHLAFWMWDKQRYKEVSYVGGPADAEAEHTDLVFVNIDGQDASDSIVNDKFNVSRRFSIMVGSIDNDQRITDIKDQDESEVESQMLFTADSEVSTQLQASDKELDNNQTSSHDNELDTGTDNSDENDPGESADEENNEVNNEADDYAKNTADRTAQIALIADMLANDAISMEDATDMLYKAGLYIQTADRTPEKIGELLDAELENRDAKLSTKRRKELPKSSFCGPNRSFPVPDCAHVTAARRLIGRFKGSASTKSRIMACVDRKAKYYGCDSSNKNNQDNTSKEEIVAKFTFDSEEELIASAPVQKAIDAIKTESEQAVDSLKQEAKDQEARFKTIAIDSIIALSQELKKPMVSKLEGKDGDDLATARDEVKEALEKRSLDALAYTLEDLRAEKAAADAAAKVSSDEEENTDENQNAVDNATGNSVGDNANESDSSDGEQTEGNDSENEEELQNADEELNQNGKEQAGQKRPNPLASFTKPVR